MTMLEEIKEAAGISCLTAWRIQREIFLTVLDHELNRALKCGYHG